MGHFRGTLGGNRGQASRLGTKSSGLYTTCNGWGVGCEASIHYNKELDKDVVSVDLSDSSIKISGCPNSCGQHGIATLGFFGGSREGSDEKAQRIALQALRTWVDHPHIPGNEVYCFAHRGSLSQKSPNLRDGLCFCHMSDSPPGEQS